MTRFKHFYIKNQMIFANALANIIGVFFANYLLAKGGPPFPEIDWTNPLAKTLDNIFTPCAFSFVAIMTLLYEKPVRQYLNAQFDQIAIPYDLEIKAKKRIINEPFVLIGLDLCMWLLSATIYFTMHWVLSSSGPYLAQRALFNNISTGLITGTVAFFLLEYILQKKLSPYFFPHGKLSEVPKTWRIRIRTRLIALLLACNLIPLLLIVQTSYSLTIQHHNFVPSFEQIRVAILTNALLFIGTGTCVTMFISRNLTSPFDEILSTLKSIKDGVFDKTIKVISNDEIGYTGDVINEMSEGLLERELIKDTFGKYVTKEIRDEVLSGRVPLDGEKKEVTVLFSDLRNFTHMTESNDPKMVVKVMNRYFAEMSEAIKAQGGLVLQFIGDEIYAVFGAPVKLDDHPTKAFRASLEMSRRLVKLNKEFKRKGWPSLQHGIGVHTGEAIAANIGSPDRLSYLLIGDTINLASRLQTLTKEVGTEMIISSSTYDLILQSELYNIKLSKLPSMRLKGKTQPVDIYALG